MAGEKLANLVNRELFAKIFLPNIHRYTKNVFSICILTVAFTCTVRQIFPVYGILCTDISALDSLAGQSDSNGLF